MTGKLLTSFFRRLNKLCIHCWFTFRCLGFDHKPITVQHVVRIFRYLPNIMLINREKCGIVIIVSSCMLLGFLSRSHGFGELLNVIRRVGTVCGEVFFQVQQSQQERQVEPIHLLKDVDRENVTFLILVLAFNHHLAQVDLVAPCQVQDVVLHQVVVAKTCLRCLDLVCFVGPNQRFLLPKHRQEQQCGERPTRSWKLVASVTVILHSLFSIRSLVILFNPCSVFITRWIVTAAARLPASNMTVPSTCTFNTGCLHSN